MERPRSDDNATENKTLGILKSIRPQDYADAVSAHAKQGIETSLYPGLNFAKLASLLQEEFGRPPNRSRGNSPHPQAYPFACRYRCTSAGGKAAVEWLRRPEEVSVDASTKTGEKVHNIIFLQGLPSSQWLSTVGGRYRIDPEFFQRHLDFWSTMGQLDYFPLPPFRSLSGNMITLCYISIGQRDSGATNSTQAEIDASRQASEKSMRRYIHHLNTSLDDGGGIGTSIVRNFDYQDETHFAVEQRISIYLNGGGDGRTTIAWIDTGRSLDQGPIGPWTGYGNKHNPNHTIFHPVIQMLPQIALKAHKMSLGNSSSNEAGSSAINPFAQSSGLLTRDYGKSLDTKLMATDPFYALHELFSFCAFSQSQYFNLLALKLDSDIMAQASSEHVADVTNLLYRQNILERHVNRLRDTIATIEARSGLQDPRLSYTSTGTPQQQAAKALLSNHQDLLARAESLSRSCQAQMALLMNRAMIAESNKAIKQAQEVTKLTKLAFVFVPLSFTASFCGMNLHPFVQTGGSVWWWFAISAPFVLVSFAFMRWDMMKLWKMVYELKKENV